MIKIKDITELERAERILALQCASLVSSERMPTNDTLVSDNFSFTSHQLDIMQDIDNTTSVINELAYIDNALYVLELSL